MTIKFITSENQARSGERTGNCIGNIEHNGTMDPAALAEALARRTGFTEVQAKSFLCALDEVIRRGISEGKRMDFGTFQIGIAMSGTLDEANSKFEPGRNDLSIYFRAARGLNQLLNKLEPVNATPMDRPWLYELGCEGTRKLNEVILGKTVSANGMNIRIDPTKEDEGVWLETDDGEKLVKGEIISNDSGHIACRFAGPLARGKYRFAIHTRDGGAKSGVVAFIRRRVKVV